jgi:miniconductance mechanosensitive channel
MGFFNWAYKLLRKADVGAMTASYINLAVDLLIIGVIAYIIDAVARRLLVFIMNIIAHKTKTQFDDFLVGNRTPQYIAHAIPLYSIYKTVPLALKGFTYWEYIFTKGITIWIIFIAIWIARSVLNAIRDYLKMQPDYNDKPIDSYVQVVMIMLWIFCITGIVLTLLIRR